MQEKLDKGTVTISVETLNSMVSYIEILECDRECYTTMLNLIHDRMLKKDNKELTNFLQHVIKNGYEKTKLKLQIGERQWSREVEETQFIIQKMLEGDGYI